MPAMDPERGNDRRARGVLLLVGPKGSGKTFVGTLVGEALGIPFLRVELTFLENLRESRLLGKALEEEGYAKVLTEVARVLSSEPLVIIESTGASEAFPDFLQALRARHRVMLVSIRAPPERCLERVRTRDPAAHVAVADDRVAEINARAARVRLPWDLEIDNGEPAPAEVLLAQFRRLLSGAPR